MSEAAWVDLVFKAYNLGMWPLIVLGSGYYQVWTWGRELRAMTVDRDFYRDVGFKRMEKLEVLVDKLLLERGINK